MDKDKSILEKIADKVKDIAEIATDAANYALKTEQPPVGAHRRSAEYIPPAADGLVSDPLTVPPPAAAPGRGKRASRKRAARAASKKPANTTVGRSAGKARNKSAAGRSRSAAKKTAAKASSKAAAKKPRQRRRARAG